MNTPMVQNAELYCSHCATLIDKEFCPQCGEARPERLHSAVIFNKVFASVFNIDKRWPATLWLLLKNPGLLIRNYHQGIRLHYANPVLMLLVFGAFFTFLYHWEPYLPELETGPASAQKMMTEITEIAMQYANYLMIVLAYPIAAASGWLWRDSTVAERYVALLYTNVLNYLVSLAMLLSGLYAREAEQLLGLSMLVMLIVFCYVGVSVRQRFWAGIWLGCWQVLLQQGLVMLLGATSAVVYLLVYKLLDFQSSLDPTRYL
jgi:hypothetical protein